MQYFVISCQSLQCNVLWLPLESRAVDSVASSSDSVSVLMTMINTTGSWPESGCKTHHKKIVKETMMCIHMQNNGLDIIMHNRVKYTVYIYDTCMV